MSIVAIVGRPNVGKSTLFNRLTGARKAIVDDQSGITRDRQYGTSDWNGKEYTVIDTGGFVPDSEDVFEAAIREQVKIAMEEADLLIFMVDVVTGITDLDDAMADILRRSKKEVLIAVNKVDNAKRNMEVAEFYGLGFKEIFPLSSITGSGTGELLDALVERLPEEEVNEFEGLPKFAIVGRPNVGKSSLINALLGEERNIVTEIAGTTRDTIHTRYNMFNMDFFLIDTAGIRKKSKVHENIEFYSVIRAIKAIEEADVCLLLIDATQGIEAQDLNIVGLAEKRGSGLVILVNKWDLVKNKETNTISEFEKDIRARIAPFIDVPIVFISVLEKQRIHKAMETAIEVYNNKKRKISTSELNKFLEEAQTKQKAPAHRGKLVKIKYATQLPTAHPSMAFFCNDPKLIKESYRNYLENRLRERFDFTGVPVRMYFRKK